MMYKLAVLVTVADGVAVDVVVVAPQPRSDDLSVASIHFFDRCVFDV
jgi:hypothetical protein